MDKLFINPEIVKRLKIWLLNWKRGIRGKPLLIYGPTGCGKTYLVKYVANELDVHLLVLGSSDVRDKNNIIKVFGKTIGIKTLDNRVRMILIDDVDTISSNDRGAIPLFESLLKSPKLPIILTATNPYDKRLKPLRQHVELIQLKKPSTYVIKQHLLETIKERNIDINQDLFNKIIKNSKGDIRSAMNDLLIGMPSNREHIIDIFNVLKNIFKSTTIVESFNTDVDPDLLKKWIVENIPIEYEDKKDIAVAYDIVSRADMFDGHILKRNYWGFMRYSMFLYINGVALSKSHIYRKFTKYQFPKFLLIDRNYIGKHIASKISAHIHLSAKKIYQQLKLYAMLIVQYKLYDHFMLEKEEINYLKKLVKL